MDDIKNKAASGLVYKFLERAGAQGTSFIISIILARILLPNDYGIVALVTVFIAICDVFVTYGFSASLIANKESDDLDFSTCFYFSLVLSAFLYVAIFFSAPLVSSFYEFDQLTLVIRVMALRIPFAAVNSLQQSYVAKKMIFKEFFYATIIGTIISGIIAVVMAYKGYGVWALVEQYLGNVIIDTFFCFIFLRWYPKLKFSFKRLKSIYSYGWKILVTGLIDTLYTELRSLIIGKKYSSEDLAYYNKGNQFPTFAIGLIDPTIDTVIFPALSKYNSDINSMKSVAKRSNKTITYLVFPILVGLFVVANSLIITVLTDKWQPAVIYLQIGCLAFLFRPLQVINNCIIKASKNSGILMKIDIIKKSIGVLLLIGSMFLGIEYIALSFAVVSCISMFINIYPSRKIIGYGYKEQLLDILPNVLVSLGMGIIVFCLGYLPLPMWLVLIIQIVSGIVVYFLLSVVTKNESFNYCLDYAKQILNKRGAK